jgi:hypothetical protein
MKRGTAIIGYMLRQGMPMEELKLETYLQAKIQARNAEEALLAALSSCAYVTDVISEIDWPRQRPLVIGYTIYADNVKVM